MKLENIICLKIEKIDTDGVYPEFEFLIYEDNLELIRRMKADENLKKNSLLIASTDTSIALGKELGIATMAYANPAFPNQSYSGVDMLVEGFEEVDADFLEKVYQRFHRIPWTILETERCVVRELTLDDLDALFELYSGEGIDQYTESLYPYEEEKEFQRAYIENMYRYFGYGLWLVFLKETGELIGRAGLEHREYNEVIELELGYIIGIPFQGQGYATEVCEAILEYAKENTGFERINSLIEEGNEASIHLSQKLGFLYLEDYELNGKRMHRFVKDFNL